MHGRVEKCTENFFRKPEGNRPLGRPRCGWKGNMRMDIWQIVCEGVDWVHLAWDWYQFQVLVNMIREFQFL
jgi:hypothetical protein